VFLKSLNKDKIKRLLNKYFEIRIRVIKSLLNYNISSIKVFNYINRMLSFLNKNCFFTKSNNICVSTGRQNGVYKVFKLSRIALRDSAYDIFGLKKSSW
jgi:ribosomal protein S14